MVIGYTMLSSLKHWSEISVDYRDEFIIGKFFPLLSCPSVLAQLPPPGLETKCCAVKLLMKNRVNLCFPMVCILQRCHRSSFVIPPCLRTLIYSRALLSLAINFRLTNAIEKGTSGRSTTAIILEAVVSPDLDYRPEPDKSLPASWLPLVTAGEHESNRQKIIR